MTLLIPLGLLGLASIGLLILIYVLKPNYQQKYISSTYVWRLSLKYKKKRVPISKLRNILLIICQILILVACALILSKPAQLLQKPVKEREIVAIIDSSASMRCEMDGVTRYERAVKGAIDLVGEAFSSNGIASVIIADEKPSFLARRVNKERETALRDSLDELLDNETACSYGKSDLNDTIDFCEEILRENPNAEFVFFTDKTYAYVPEKIKLVSVADEEEWNAAILGAEATFDDNYYTFTVDVASYGRDVELEIEIEINGANALNSADKGQKITLTGKVLCNGDRTKRVIFRNADLTVEDYEEGKEDIVFIPIDEGKKIYSYQTVHISIDELDNFVADNIFEIYGGQKELLKVLYASTLRNPFVPGILDVFKKDIYNDVWDIRVTEMKVTDPSDVNEYLLGYDLYIFEHFVPDSLPSDGLVMLFDPDRSSAAAGFTVSGFQTYEGDDGKGMPLSTLSEHPLLDFISIADTKLTKVSVLSKYDSEYEVLANCAQYPAMLFKDRGMSKVLVCAFNIHFSTQGIDPFFASLFYNLFENYIPATVDRTAFEVDEQVTLRCRGEKLTVTGYEYEEEFQEFPAKIYLNTPGSYTFTQETDFGKYVTEQIFLKIPAVESNIFAKEDGLKNPYSDREENEIYNDLLLYLAIALVTLVAVEWLLQAKDNF